MNKLTALIEAAKAADYDGMQTEAIFEANAYFEYLANPATILELCALLEKAEEALKQSVIVRERLMRWRRNSWPTTDQESIVSGEYPLMDHALAAIKQWKEQA